MKKALVVPAFLTVMALGYLIRNHMNYGEALAPGLPSDIPIIEGKVISGLRLGSKRILLEIHSRETATYITMAIHLGKWW